MTDRFIVLSFNILAPCWASPKWYPQDLNPDLLDRLYRRNKIIQFLSSVQADLICLQEVSDAEFKAISAAFPHFKGFMSHNDPSYWSESLVPEIPWEPNGTAILARKNFFTSLQFEDRALSESGNHATRLVADQDNLRIVVWSVHLDSEKPQNRKLELESLMDQVDWNREIIAGDFNIDVESSNLRHLLGQNQFVDALRAVGNFEGTHPFSSTYYRSHTYAVIDHVMTRGLHPVSGDVFDFGFWSIKNETGRIEANLQMCGSDHFPVISTLRL